MYSVCACVDFIGLYVCLVKGLSIEVYICSECDKQVTAISLLLTTLETLCEQVFSTVNRRPPPTDHT